MEKKFDPRGKERKRTNRKKWYKAVCSLAAAVVVCTVYTLMLPALTLDEESAGDAGVTISESSVPTSEAPAAESSKSDNGSESHNDTAADSSADSSHAATESGPAAAAPSDDRAPSTTNPTTEGEHNAPVTLPTEETNSGAITGSSESHDEVTSPDTNDQEKIKDEENNGSPAADKEETDEEEADNSGSSTDADTEEDDSEKSDDTADVETASDWEKTIPDLSDCETWAEKLLAVAQSQIGYHESTLNFHVEDGEHKGYTRYGEWYGSPYGDWCAMFVSFCLNYAGIDEEAIPQDANCSNWVKNLKEMGIYEDADLYMPEAGDIVFFDRNGEDRSDHVGIISEVKYGTKTVTKHITSDGSAVESGALSVLKYIKGLDSENADDSAVTTENVEVQTVESIKVIEGNSSDQVQYVDYDIANEKILGYVSLTNAKDVFDGVDKNKEVENTVTAKAEVEGSAYTVTATYDAAAFSVPVTLTAKELVQDSADSTEAEKYTENYDKVVNALKLQANVETEEELNISAIKLFDISFIDAEGNEVEPASGCNVKVKIDCSEAKELSVAEESEINVVHVANSGAVEILETEDVKTDSDDNIEQVEFTQSSFSVTALVTKKNFLKGTTITDSPAIGTPYLIYTEGKALSISGGNISTETVSESAGGTITAPIGTTQWTLESAGDSRYYIKDSNGKYLTYSNGRLAIGSTGTSWSYDRSGHYLSCDVGRTYFKSTYYVYYSDSNWNLTRDNRSTIYFATVETQSLTVVDNCSISIGDTVKSDGLLTATIKNGEQTVTDLGELSLKWVRVTDDGTESDVTKVKVTGDLYNLPEGSSPENSKLNVSLDAYSGAIEAKAGVKYYAVLADKDGNAIVDSNGNIIKSAESAMYYRSLQNGSFETPVLTNPNDDSWLQSSTFNNIVWKTTASDRLIELVTDKSSGERKYKYRWGGSSIERTGSYFSHGIRNASEGHQFAELNANTESSLYQDVLTTPGVTMYWNVDHAMRSTAREHHDKYKGEDKMYVVIMSAEQAASITSQEKLKAVAAYIKEHQNDENIVYNGVDYTGAQSMLFSNDSNTWETHSGDYTVPDNQYYTRFFFVAASTASKDNTVGNCIDNIHFSTEMPAPNPDHANIVITKKIYGAADNSFTKVGSNTKLTADTDLTFTLKVCKNGTVDLTKTIYAKDVANWTGGSDSAGQYYMADLTDLISVNIPANTTDRYTFIVEESSSKDYAISGNKYQGTSITINNTAQGTEGQNTYSATQEIEGGTSYSVLFTNSYIADSYELPETGGPGTALIYLLGGMLLVTPLTIRVISRRRRKRGDF